MTNEDYALIANTYAQMSGEQLVADGNYVEPLWESTHVAVGLDQEFAEKQSRRPGLTDKMQFERIEIAKRVAAMILIQTYGVKAFDDRLWRGLT